MQELYGVDKIIPAMGPATDDWFYFDFDTPEDFSLSEKDFKDIEKRMRQIIKKKYDMVQETVSVEKAQEMFAHNPYKLEWIKEYWTDWTISLYHTGDQFVDVCKWPHVPKTSDIKAFKLLKFAWAYRRWNEKNKMLTRIYGTAFDNKDDLKEYMHFLEEAKKRDHRVLGEQLKLFTISPLVGSGLPLLQPNGMIIRQEVENYLRSLHKHKWYQRVRTPHIAKQELYQTSGHRDKFGDELFKVQWKDEHFCMKPMNCPHHMQIFADNQFSYRDMPVRYFEPATVYRDEKKWQLSWLTRVRAITQDDGHLFCRVSQLQEEVGTIVEIIRTFYSRLGMMDDYRVSLSVRWDDKSLYLGEDDARNKAESALEESAKTNNLNYKVVTWEAAFYGPKLDFMFKDSLKRERQLATIQVDFNLPERFDLHFVNENGDKERPVVIHRAISWSFERFMWVMIEHFAGAFPYRLAPQQIRIIPVAEKFVPYADKLYQKLKSDDVRVSLDDGTDSFAKKVRNAEKSKIPYMFILWEQEENNSSVNVRDYATKEQREMSLEDFLEMVKE